MIPTQNEPQIGLLSRVRVILGGNDTYYERHGPKNDRGYQTLPARIRPHEDQGELPQGKIYVDERHVAQIQILTTAQER